jgi:predicted O-methyltransferase YrrM
VRAVGEAVHEALTRALSAEELRLISLIERRRGALLGSGEEIEVVDFGAGGPDDRRSEEQMRAGVRSTRSIADVSRASKPALWAKILFKLVRKLEPASCVELGSCVGISAGYLAAALQLNGRGRLVTLEGSPAIAGVAQRTLAGLSFDNATVVTGPFHDTLSGVLEAARPVDFFFNDGHHDRDAVLRYFDAALPCLSDDAVLVVDDISWSPGMREAWRLITEHERVAASVDLGAMGIALLGQSGHGRAHHTLPL